MAEGFEPYHVPQQSRRDKLRVAAAAAAELHGLMTAQLPPPYDHRNLIEVSGSSSPSDLLTCTPTEDNLMAMAGLGSSASSSGLRNPYGSFDPSLLYGAASQMMHTGAAAASFKPEPLSLSLSSAYDNDNGMGVNDGVSRGSVPLGPFTGYASVLKGSRFLLPAQQLLEELCCEAVVGAVSPETLAPDSSLMVMDTNAVVDDDDDYDHHHDRGDNGDGDDDQNRKNKSTLISMLHEVYRRYEQYYQQMQAVVTSFEYVAGLGNAAPYGSLAVKAMTRHFRCLKNAIMDQLQFANKESNGYPGHHGKDETAPTFRNNNNNNNRGVVYGQMVRPTGHHGFDHQPVWRPQRGLPERAVTVLRAWLFEHFLHPYPTDTDKLMLAKQTGLSRSQVSNWFINARVRLWKPMVEEIHMLETRQAQNNNNNKASVSASMTTTRPNNDTTANHPKRSRNDNNNDNNELIPGCLTDGVIMGLSYEDGPAGPSGSGVSLTLGLHQDDDDDGPGSMCLAQRFGIGEGYVVAGGAFEAAHHHQTRHFGSQLLRDFVG